MNQEPDVEISISGPRSLIDLALQNAPAAPKVVLSRDQVDRVRGVGDVIMDTLIAIGGVADIIALSEFLAAQVRRLHPKSPFSLIVIGTDNEPHQVEIDPSAPSSVIVGLLRGVIGPATNGTTQKPKS